MSCYVYGSNYSSLNTETSYTNRLKIYASYKACVFYLISLSILLSNPGAVLEISYLPPAVGWIS